MQLRLFANTLNKSSGWAGMDLPPRKWELKGKKLLGAPGWNLGRAGWVLPAVNPIKEGWRQIWFYCPSSEPLLKAEWGIPYWIRFICCPFFKTQIILFISNISFKCSAQTMKCKKIPLGCVPAASNHPKFRSQCYRKIFEVNRIRSSQINNSTETPLFSQIRKKNKI